jgi:hypothetical protein
MMEDVLTEQLKFPLNFEEGLRKFLLAGEEPDLTLSKIKIL